MLVPPEAPPRAREAEHRQGNGDGDVDSDLPRVDLVDELAGVAAARGEDRRAVAVGVGVDDLDGVLEGVSVHEAEDRAEYFLAVALVGGQDVGEDCGADEVAVGVFFDVYVAAVQDTSCALVERKRST